MTLPALYDFTADYDPLTTDSVWSQHGATADSGQALSGVFVDGSGNSNDKSAYWAADAFANDQYAEIIITDGTASASGFRIGLILRAGAGNPGLLVRWKYDTHTFEAYRWDSGGSRISLGSAHTPSSSMVDGAVMRLEIVGTTLTLKIDYGAGFVTETTWDASAGPASGSPGVYIVGPATAVAVGDGFAAGNIASGPAINSVDSDNKVREGQSAIAVAWSNGSASGNTLTVSPTNDINDVNAITPTITSESATGCTVTGPFSFPTGVAEGGNSYWFVTDASANDSASLTVVRSDLTPGAFSFTDQTDVAVSTLITSAAITITGIDDLSPISVSGGEYEINNSGTWLTSASTVSNGDTVKVRHTSSASNATATNTTLTSGGMSDIFTSTTIAASLAFDFSGAGNIFKDNTASALVSKTGIVADMYLTSTGDRVGARKTGIATDSSGNIGNITDAALTSAPHDLIIRFAEGNTALVRGKTPA